MSEQPLCLDLFSGAGGAARGYADAGFEVIGVDIDPQPRYPYEFERGDVFELLPDLLRRHRPALVHASPTCRDHTTLAGRVGLNGTGWQLAEIRTRLAATGLPYVIENVVGAALVDPIWLCGTHFGLRSDDRWLKRHRGFESNLPLTAPGPCTCRGRSIGGVYGTGSTTGPNGRGWKFPVAGAREAMGIDWMTKKEMSQAIPPAYTRWVGAQVLARIGVAA